MKMQVIKLTKAFFALLIIITSTTSLQAQNVEEMVLKAIKYQEAGKYDEAIKTYDETLKKHGDNPIVYLLKTEAYVKKASRVVKGTNMYHSMYDKNSDTYQLALKSANKAIELIPNSHVGYETRGLMYQTFHKYALAEQDFNKVLTFELKEKDYYSALIDRATARIYLKKYKEADADFQKVFEQKSVSVGTYMNAGALYEQMKQYDKAIKYYKKGLEVSPNNPGIMNNIGYTYVVMKEFKKAEEWFNKLLKLVPNMSYAWSNMGYIKIMTQRMAEGKQNLEKAIELMPNNAFAYKYLAIYYIKKKQKDKACQSLKKANELGYSVMFDSAVNELLKKHCE
jgi:tetratricopeptide (TPR) repeat protein